MDLYCNAILGRPSYTFDNLCCPIDSDEAIDNSNRPMRALLANFRLCPIIEAISLKLLQHNFLELEAAEAFLRQLRTWARELPEGLRLSPSKERQGPQEATHRDTAVGNVHIACCYYFGVILTTRQFLVTIVTSRIRQRMRRAEGIRVTGSHLDGHSNTKSRQLAGVCCKSAVYMVQMCHEAGCSEFLLPNMCLLQ